MRIEESTGWVAGAGIEAGSRIVGASIGLEAFGALGELN